MQDQEKEQIQAERSEILHLLEDWLEPPMFLLGFVWLVLLMIELIYGLQPFLQVLTTIIWVIFIIDFGLRFWIAPQKSAYLKSNWLTAISLMIPALRVFRIARVLRLAQTARATRGMRLVRVLSSINRGMRSLGGTMRRRGFAYVISLTLIVLFAGAAGMYAFENNPESPFNSYGSSVWWTAMILTTMGSEYWPKSPEGRFLCLILAIYAFAVFGYVTATLASYFVGRDAESQQTEITSVASIQKLTAEIAALRKEIQRR